MTYPGRTFAKPLSGKVPEHLGRRTHRLAHLPRTHGIALSIYAGTAADTAGLASTIAGRLLLNDLLTLGYTNPL
jgi:hypothetical protein